MNLMKGTAQSGEKSVLLTLIVFKNSGKVIGTFGSTLLVHRFLLISRTLRSGNSETRVMTSKISRSQFDKQRTLTAFIFGNRRDKFKFLVPLKFIIKMVSNIPDVKNVL